MWEEMMVHVSKRPVIITRMALVNCIAHIDSRRLTTKRESTIIWNNK